MPATCRACDGQGAVIDNFGDTDDCWSCAGSGLLDDDPGQLVLPINGLCGCSGSFSDTNNSKERTA